MVKVMRHCKQIAQIGGRYPIPENIHGQVAWDPEQPHLVQDVSAYCRGLDQMTFKGHLQPKLFYDSINLIP